MHIKSGGVTLCAQSYGDPEHPALLLLMGAGCSMLWWEEPFCTALADSGFFVIRYDHRDTGLSSNEPMGEPGYTFEDLADDAIRVLDAYGLTEAIFMGMSMGGMLAQIAAVRHPERVCGLVLLSSMYFGEGAEHLPGSSPAVNAFFEEPLPDLDADPQVWVQRFVRQWSICAHGKRPFDELRYTALASADVKRAACFPCSTNHAHVQGSFEDLASVHAIRVPTLIIHGTEDVVIPFAHGQMLARTMAGARLLSLEGTGHELHPADYPVILQAISERFRR